MEDTLLVYYSHTGVTRELVRKIVQRRSCDLEEIHEREPRHFGFQAFISSGFQALTAQESTIEDLFHNLNEYEHIVIGTPVWAGHMSPPIRSFLNRYRDDINRASFFCTYGGNGGIKVLEEMTKLYGKAVGATYAFSNEMIQNPDYLNRRLEDFIQAWPQKVHKRREGLQETPRQSTAAEAS